MLTNVLAIGLDTPIDFWAGPTGRGGARRVGTGDAPAQYSTFAPTWIQRGAFGRAPYGRRETMTW